MKKILILQLSFLFAFAIIISSCDTASQKDDKSKMTLLALAGGGISFVGTSCADGTYGYLTLSGTGKSSIEGPATCATASYSGVFTTVHFMISTNETIMILFPGNATGEFTTHSDAGKEYIGYITVSPPRAYTTAIEPPYSSSGYIKITSYGSGYVEGTFHGVVQDTFFIPSSYNITNGSFKAKI
jgi:hypothetical protein